MADSELLWQCRRGMKELDVVIERFIKCGYEDLGDDMKISFQQLMEVDDGLLFEWIIGVSSPKEEKFQELIKIILSCLDCS